MDEPTIQNIQLTSREIGYQETGTGSNETSYVSSLTGPGFGLWLPHSFIIV